MTLLSSFDDIMTLEAEPVEKEVGGEKGGEKAKLPRSNSLEDLGIKVRTHGQEVSKLRQEVSPGTSCLEPEKGFDISYS